VLLYLKLVKKIKQLKREDFAPSHFNCFFSFIISAGITAAQIKDNTEE